MTLTTTSASETQAVGRRLGELLTGGEVIGLTGDLGSGKTCLIQGIAAGLGVDPATVTSPTFVLLHVHRGRLPLCHLDLYRLGQTAGPGDTPGNVNEVAGLFETATDEPSAVTAIEWAEWAGPALPPEHLMIRLAPAGRHRRHRTLYLTGHGSRYRELLSRLQIMEPSAGPRAS